MNNFLLWIGGLVTLCLGLLFAAPHFIDWNGYRSIIEKEASRYFGRTVRVGGEVNLRVLPVPYVSFDKLSIADTDGTTGAPIIRADNFKMWLSVPPLLQGVMEAHHIELRRPVIELVTNAAGGGNWQSLQLRSGAMSYLPGGFALEALDVIDGQVVVRNTAGTELTRFETINGTLSATAIEGPYKFAGSFKWQNTIRTLRLATARPSSDGVVRIKSSIASPERGGNSFVLDGVFNSQGGGTAFAGDVTAKLSATPSHTADDVHEGVAAKPGSARATPAAFDLKARLNADTTALRLQDINLALQTDGPPQLLTGKADLTWTKETVLNVDLSSRWIDFDRFSFTSGKPAPLDNARQLLVALGRSLPEQADTNVQVAFDQATLGGEALGAIQFEAVRRTGPLKLKEFEASVPGGGKVAISGELSVSKSKPGFRGQLAADGQSLLKFLRWGLGDDALASGLTDGPFSLESDLALGEQSFELTNATADFGATPLKGNLKMTLGAARRVALDLEGNVIHWNRLSPAPFNVGVARKLMTEAPALEATRSGKTKKSEATPEMAQPGSRTWAGFAASSDLQLNLKATKLIDGDHVYRDFTGKLNVLDGQLSVPELKFTRDSGLSVDVGAEAGRGGDDKSPGSRGKIKGIIAAASHIAVADLLQFLEASDLDPVLRERISALAPLRVASTIELGKAGEPATDMRFDGISHGGRLVAAAHFSRGLRDWRAAPASLTASIENKSAKRLFSLISSSRTFSKTSKSTGSVARSARLYLKSAGTHSKGML
nr:AsmA family protein [Alphaproteobacteria bacterium]